MRYFILTLTALLALSGCRSLTINVSHADTNKGYLNSSLRDLGQFYFFDTETGDLKELARINLTNRNKGAIFTRQVARDVRGVEIGGEAKVAIKAKVAAEVAKSSYIELDNAFDESYENTFADLAKEINRREATGDEVGFSWFLDDAVQPGSTIRYLLVYSTIRADAARIGYANAYATGGKIKIPTGRGGGVDVSLTGLSEESFSGKSVPVLVDYHVIQAFKKDGFYRFRIDRTFNNQSLTRLLKTGDGKGPADETD